MKKLTFRLTEELKRLTSENYDHCVKCKYRFNEGDTTHQGYGAKNKPLYLCDKCSADLKETAIRNYFTPRPYAIPPENTELWRFMDFAKYVSILANNGLYFARADTFEDLFEGAKGTENRKKEWENYYLLYFRSALKNSPKGCSHKRPEKEVEVHSSRLLKELESAGRQNRTSTFINCWHENKVESEVMWRLYSNYFENALAIKTSFQNLHLSMGRNPLINIGRVKYIDFSDEYAPINGSFWYKRKSFEHEREVRAIIIDNKSADRGKIIHCNLSILIKEVFVSPRSPSWFVNAVNGLNEKYCLDVKVSTSKLNEEHFF